MMQALKDRTRASNATKARRHWWQFAVFVSFVIAFLFPFVSSAVGLQIMNRPNGWKAAFARGSAVIYQDGKFFEVRDERRTLWHAISIKSVDGAALEAASTQQLSVAELRALLSVYSFPTWSIFRREPYPLESSLPSLEFGAGLPFRWIVVTTSAPPAKHGITIERNSALYDATGIHGRVLVGRLITNIVVVFAITLVLLQSPFIFIAVRRRIRIKRGQCPECAYPATAAACPECGYATAASSTPTSS